MERRDQEREREQERIGETNSENEEQDQEQEQEPNQEQNQETWWRALPLVIRNGGGRRVIDGQTTGRLLPVIPADREYVRQAVHRWEQGRAVLEERLARGRVDLVAAMRSNETWYPTLSEGMREGLRRWIQRQREGGHEDDDSGTTAYWDDDINDDGELRLTTRRDIMIGRMNWASRDDTEARFRRRAVEDFTEMVAVLIVLIMTLAGVRLL